MMQLFKTEKISRFKFSIIAFMCITKHFILQKSIEKCTENETNILNFQEIPVLLTIIYFLIKYNSCVLLTLIIFGNKKLANTI